MAYNARNLRAMDPLSDPDAPPAVTPQFYTYVTADSAATVGGAGYFNGATKLLNPADVILLVSSYGGTPAVALKIVTANSGGVVTIA